MERVWAFLDFAQGHVGGESSVFDFNRFVLGPRVNAYSARVDSWHLDHWGTDSNAVGATYGNFIACGDKLTAIVLFETAWAEPSPILFRASELFRDLQFDLHFYEPLGDFAGFVRCTNGEVIDDVRRACEHTYENKGMTP